MAGIVEDDGIEAALRELHEAQEVEIKQWIDPTTNENKAKIAKGVMCLANYGGGLLVIGFKQQADGTFAADPNVPENMKVFSSDAIQGIIDSYLSPPVQCRVYHRLHPTLGTKCVVIRVPSVDLVPIRPKRGAEGSDGMVPWRIYVRRKGPKSEEIQNDEEWTRLLDLLLRNRRGELLRSFRSLLAGELPHAAPAQPSREDRLRAFTDEARLLWAGKVAALPADSPARFPQGHHEVALAFSRVNEEPRLPALKEAIRHLVRNHSGWPPFVSIDREPLRPYLKNGAVEAWGAPEDDWRAPDQHDFWRISQDGCFYLRRGFREDSRPDVLNPGSGFDLVTSVQKVAETIMEARYLASVFGADESDLICMVHFVGLAGRTLVSFGDRRHIVNRYQVHQDYYEASTTVLVGAIPDLLPETVDKLLRPLYELFDFTIPAALFPEEISRLLQSQYPR